MNMNSLDPRVKRLPDIVDNASHKKEALDQWVTYEVFVQPRDGKPFQHEGIVHAPDLEMAFLLAKESLTRRFQCISIFVVDTRQVMMSATTEGDVSVYDAIAETTKTGNNKFEIFHLPKRGKQHVHVGSVEAANSTEALSEAKKKFGSTKAYNIWVIPVATIRYTSPEEKDLWNTLPEKKFRDAAEYKGGDKLKEFLERNR